MLALGTAEVAGRDVIGRVREDVIGRGGRKKRHQRAFRIKRKLMTRSGGEARVVRRMLSRGLLLATFYHQLFTSMDISPTHLITSDGSLSKGHPG